MMEIRAYQASDLDNVVNLYIHVFNGDPWNDQWVPEKARDYLGDIIATPGFQGWVVETEGRVVGLLLGHSTRWWSSIQFVLKEMCIEQTLQRTGLGSKLVQEALTSLKRQQIKRINLLTSRMTWPANFWKKNGFAESSFIQFMVASL